MCYAINSLVFKELLLDQITSFGDERYYYANPQHPRDNMIRHFIKFNGRVDNNIITSARLSGIVCPSSLSCPSSVRPSLWSLCHSESFLMCFSSYLHSCGRGLLKKDTCSSSGSSCINSLYSVLFPFQTVLNKVLC